MKNFKNSIAFLAIVALLFTSCSKDEVSDVASPDIQDTFQLQFGVLLNDFNKVQQQTKDHEAPPVECRTDDPAYVKVGIKKPNGFFVGDNNNDAVKDVVLIEVDIKNNNDSWETVFSDDLGLPAGTYSLEYFIVYDADDEILWVAPRKGGAYASSVDDPLEFPIVLGAGTKPYIDVDVLCFIPREEEAYGYLFFDFELTEVINNYCIFVNFCDDESGREYPAKFMVDVWKNSKIPANRINLDPNMNSVSGSGNDFAATVLCLPLPPLDGQDVYIVRVTVLDAGAYDADASDFKEFTITQIDINGQLNEVPAYEHIRINCGDDDGNGECDPNDDTADCDNDGVLNGVDQCKGEGVRGSVDAVGCPIIDTCDLASPNDDCDDDGILNKCDTTNPNYGDFDCDGDNLTNDEEATENTDPNDPDTDADGRNDNVDKCPLDGPPSEGQIENPDRLGCYIVPNPNPACTISARSGCTMGTTDGQQTGVVVGEFIDIIDSGGDLIAVGSILILNDKVNVSVSPLFGFYISDYEIELLPDGETNADTKCAEGIAEPSGELGLITVPFEFDEASPYTVRIKVNTCTRS